MNVTTDDLGRLTNSDMFRPKTPYGVEKTAESWIKVTELVPAPETKVAPATPGEGELVKDPKTGLMVWTGPVEENLAEFVIVQRHENLF